MFQDENRLRLAGRVLRVARLPSQHDGDEPGADLRLSVAPCAASPRGDEFEVRVWGDMAREALTFKKGTRVEISGRLRSKQKGRHVIVANFVWPESEERATA